MLKTLKRAAGKRRTWVKVQKATDAASSAATSFAVNPEYLTEFGRWGEEMMTSGYEFQQALQTIASLQGVLRLSFDPKTAGISARDRVTIGNRVLEIACPAINEGGRNETILLYLIETEQA